MTGSSLAWPLTQMTWAAQGSPFLSKLPLSAGFCSGVVKSTLPWRVKAIEALQRPAQNVLVAPAGASLRQPLAGLSAPVYPPGPALAAHTSLYNRLRTLSTTLCGLLAHMLVS